MTINSSKIQTANFNAVKHERPAHVEMHKLSYFTLDVLVSAAVTGKVHGCNRKGKCCLTLIDRLRSFFEKGTWTKLAK